MSNLLVIVFAKTVLLAGVVLWQRPRPGDLARALAIAYAVGSAFGLVFFVLFYMAVPAIGYHARLGAAFITVNATLSYGATAATLALLPLDLAPRRRGSGLGRELAYHLALTAICAVALAATANGFARAVAIGALVMTGAEVAALALGRAGPVSRMVHGELAPLGAVLAASAGLGAFYESLNLAFPVWEWVTLDMLPVAVRAAIMTAIGYIVLVHPLFVATRLLIPPPRRRTGGGSPAPAAMLVAERQRPAKTD
jgi:hypothetical protein